MSTNNLLRSVFALLALPLFATSAQDTTVQVRRIDIPISGATLAADIYEMPSMGQPQPTILVRTPYGRGSWRTYGEFFARRGYVFIAQDVRGRGASTGDHVPFLNEEADGAQTLDWIVAQPWSNGSVGMMAPSYGAFAAMILVARGHPALKAVINNSGMIDLDELVFTGGALNLMVGLPWVRLFAGPRVSPQQQWDSLFATLPVVASFQGPAAGFIDGYPEFNQRLYDAGAVARLRGRVVPVLHVTGWNDFLYRHTLSAFRAMRESGAEQTLIVGPWAHDQQQRAGRVVLGGEDFGEAASFGPDSIRAVALGWFNRHLRGKADTVRPASIRVFIMGVDRWVETDRWPLREAREQTWYLDSDANARGTASTIGAGRLVPKVSAKGASDEYVYDPAAPVPTRGGVNFHFFTENLGPLDQRVIESRQDVLTYTTAPFDRGSTLAGPVTVTLYVSSSAPDADFTAKLVLVRPDGSARIIEDGILRSRFREGRRKPKLLTKDAIVPIRIEVGETALTIPAGSQLRLEVSSGNFPKYDRNPQTGDNPLTATALARATHRVHHGARYPSSIKVWIAPTTFGVVPPEPATRPGTPITPEAPAPAPSGAPPRSVLQPEIGAGCLGFSHLNSTVSPTGEAVLTGYPVVTRTTPSGPAISADIHVGDTIVAINGEDLMKRGRIPMLTPGATAIVTVRRNKVRDHRVTVGSLAQDENQPVRRDSSGTVLPPFRVCRSAPR